MDGTSDLNDDVPILQLYCIHMFLFTCCCRSAAVGTCTRCWSPTPSSPRSSSASRWASSSHSASWARPSSGTPTTQASLMSFHNVYTRFAQPAFLLSGAGAGTGTWRQLWLRLHPKKDILYINKHWKISFLRSFPFNIWLSGQKKKLPVLTT